MFPVRIAGAAAVFLSSFALAQTDVVIPGVEIAGWGKVGEVHGRFGRPPGAATKAPAVLILHGSAGVDGRGAFYAKALEEAGIATLEIAMFGRGARPRSGHAANSRTPRHRSNGWPRSQA